MDSPIAAALIAHVTFWVLIAVGIVVGELSTGGVALFLFLWLAGWVGLSYVPLGIGAVLFAPFVAVLDIVLVFLIAKGDVRRT